MSVWVSDHAVMRWLERVHKLTRDLDHGLPVNASDRSRARYGCQLLGITMAEARATICPERLHDGIQRGARAIMADNGICFPIKGKVVTTCLTKDMRRARTMHA